MFAIVLDAHSLSHPSLGSSMTHHIRRLFMSPLPAFEGEMAALCVDVPPAVVAASKCLAICIEVGKMAKCSCTQLINQGLLQRRSGLLRSIFALEYPNFQRLYYYTWSYGIRTPSCILR